MYNIKAESINRFTATRMSQGDVNMSNFTKDCLSSFRKSLPTGMKEYAEVSSYCLEIGFTSQDITSSSSTSEEEEGEGIMVIPKNIMTTLQGEQFRGSYYAFLMTHPLRGKKTSAHIGYSTNPMLDVHLHNTLAMNDRTTSAAAPHWILDMVLGPFNSAELAIECTREWVSFTRGKESKRRKAYFLSRIYNVPLYSAAIKPTITLRDYLIEKAPPNYLACYEKMIATPNYHSTVRQSNHNKKKKRKHLSRPPSSTK